MNSLNTLLSAATGRLGEYEFFGTPVSVKNCCEDWDFLCELTQGMVSRFGGWHIGVLGGIYAELFFHEVAHAKTSELLSGATSKIELCPVLLQGRTYRQPTESAFDKFLTIASGPIMSVAFRVFAIALVKSSAKCMPRRLVCVMQAGNIAWLALYLASCLDGAFNARENTDCYKISQMDPIYQVAAFSTLSAISGFGFKMAFRACNGCFSR